MKEPKDPRDITPRIGSPLWMYLAAATTAGCALLGVSLAGLGWAGFENLLIKPLIWTITCLVILGELRPIVTSTGGSGGESSGAPTSTPFSFALLLYYGLPAAALVQAFATLTAGVARRHSWHRTLFNVAQYTLSLAVAASAIALMYPGGPPSPWVPTGGELPIVAAAATGYFVLNSLLVGSAVALHERASLRRVLRKEIGPQFLVTGALLSLAPLVVVVMDHSLLLVPLFLLPLIAVYASASVSVKREHQANHDELTGLANRKYLIHRVQEALADAQAGTRRVGLMLLDLDRFKEVNDTLGHPTGDRLLQIMAQRLTHSVRPGDLVARLGGDEFAVLLPSVRDGAAAREVAARLRVALAEPVRLDGMSFDLEASIGIALYPDHAPDFEMIMQRADVAMYVAKESRTGVEMYVADKDRNSADRLALFGELRRGVADGEVELYYQPKVGLRDGQVLGVEALARWRHPERGLLLPSDFVAMAERSYLMRTFTEHVVGQALRQAAAWHRAGLRVPVAVNVSGRDLLDTDLLDTVRTGLLEHRLRPQTLQIEISETALAEDSAAARETLSELAAMGVGIVVDDLAGGYVLLERHRLPPLVEVKIDTAVIRRADRSHADQLIIRSIVEIIQALGVRSVAEGVENEPTAEILRIAGCDAAQGWHFAKPMPADLATEWLRGAIGSTPVPAMRDGEIRP
ncbi:diguanylate cyclase/phosphodiesterase [Allonocardiopsis opalescens]|uniref:Diguanylate cyclase/phosphodiesterase n=2 Tax=Allonocardiopsis opalescens TaxID=1144618 RepID=A0A2T0QDY9_9ACTN|nr:EAL domain-containing protein [Allonocardiopsis opalescens]PRY02125.1 diguanylate cyclase/phosphodiesterase [Allonocardiopsis opalescens]